MFSHGVAPLSWFAMCRMIVVSRFLAPKLRTRMLRYKMQQLDAESATATGDVLLMGSVSVCGLVLGVFHNVGFVLRSSRYHGITSLLY